MRIITSHPSDSSTVMPSAPTSMRGYITASMTEEDSVRVLEMERHSHRGSAKVTFKTEFTVLFEVRKDVISLSPTPSVQLSNDVEA
jgi:pyruvate/2-oxoglutarate/acetoin dehydrogenase E1 component